MRKLFSCCSVALLLCCSVALSLIIAEVLARVHRSYAANPLQITIIKAENSWGQPDQELGWVNKEGNNYVSSEPGNNRMGFWSDFRRASAAEVPKSEDPRPRIWIFGDSWTQGMGAADGDTYAWKLNEELPDVVVENFGTGGYSTFQAYELYQRMLSRRRPRHPRITILGFTLFMSTRDISFWSPQAGVGSMDLTNFRRPPFVTINADGQAQTSSPWITEPWPGERFSAFLSLTHTVFLRGYTTWLGKAETQGKQVTVAIVDWMARLARANNSQFLLVYLEQGDRMAWKEVTEDLQQRGVATLACDIPDKDLSYFNGGDPLMHPSPKYHAHFAKCIADYLRQNEILADLSPPLEPKRDLKRMLKRVVGDEAG